MRISDHARERMKERCGFRGKTQDKMARKAYEQGITHSQTKGNLNKWITSLFFSHQKANNIRLYGDHAYIFRDDTLITVFPIPVSLRKNKDKMIRK